MRVILALALAASGVVNSGVVKSGGRGLVCPSSASSSGPCAPRDRADPIVTGIDIPAASDALEVTINAFSAFDEYGVTGYYVSDSSTPPLGSDAGWSATPQTSFTFSSTGTHAIYGFAKDASGRISEPASDSVSIVIDYLANNGFEDVDATWTFVQTAGTAARVGSSDGVAPHGGSWQARQALGSGAQDTQVQQTISGDDYRASSGDWSAWWYLVTPASVATDDAGRFIALLAIAYDSGNSVLGRVDFVLAGAKSAGAYANTGQREALTGGAWAQRTLDVRTALDAAVGANLANVDHVMFSLRANSSSAATTLLSDDWIYE